MQHQHAVCAVCLPAYPALHTCVIRVHVSSHCQSPCLGLASCMCRAEMVHSGIVRALLHHIPGTADVAVIPSAKLVMLRAALELLSTLTTCTPLAEEAAEHGLLAKPMLSLRPFVTEEASAMCVAAGLKSPDFKVGRWQDPNRLLLRGIPPS